MRYLLFALTTLTLLGCGDSKKKPRAQQPDAGELAPDAGTPDDGTPDAGSPVTGNTGTVKGRVTYADGTAIGQVTVHIGGKEVRSDSRGVFEAKSVPKGEASVSVADSNASGAQVSVKVDTQKTTQVDLAVLPMQTVKVASVDKAGPITDSSTGVTVTVAVSDKSFNTKQGKVATGEGEMRYGVATESVDVRAAPGGMKVAMADDTMGQLESFGMIDLRFTQAGEELVLAKPIDLDLPLGPNAFADAAEVDVYSFDTTLGLWKPDGKATIDKSAGGNGIAKVKPTHLSWWCVGTPVAAQSCLSGKLLTEANTPLAGMQVNAVGLDYWGTTYAITGSDGSFCLDVKEGSQTTVSAFGSADAHYFEWKQDVTAVGAASCGMGECTDLGSLMGTNLFDECKGNVSSDQNHVLVLSSGDTALDATLQAALERFGHTVTVGVAYTAFDGTLDLTPYDAIYLQANYNWGAGDMPLAGQRQLINWVNCGGGLATTEWTTWKIGSSAFQLIDAIFPAARTTSYGSPTMETYSVVTPEPTLNAGLPESFTFTTTNYSGVESNLNPRPGAVIYYDSAMQDSGLLGWDYNLGRVASFSTTVGTSEVADPNFTRLIANVLDWLQRDTP